MFLGLTYGNEYLSTTLTTSSKQNCVVKIHPVSVIQLTIKSKPGILLVVDEGKRKIPIHEKMKNIR